MSDNLPQVYKPFKYHIGQKFIGHEGAIVEITGYNHLLNAYIGLTRFRLSHTTTSIQSNIIHQEYLDNMQPYNEVEELNRRLSSMKKDERVKYKIYYVDPNPATETLRGQKAQNITIELTGLRALTRMLNNMIKRNPSRRITLVCIVDENDKYLSHVKFLPQEIRKQKFLTGMKERLLAHAKYERGYELSIGF